MPFDPNKPFTVAFDPRQAYRKVSPGLVGEVTGAMATLNRAIPFADELADAAQAGVDILAGRSKPSEAYRKARARSKAASQDFEDRRPVAANLVKGTGLAIQAVPAALVGGAPAAPAVAPAVTSGLRGLMASSARAALPAARAATAAGLGAQVAGYGSEGTLAERQQAANAATLPAMAVGAAIPVGIAAASKGRRVIANAGRSAGRTATRLANRASGGQLLDPQMEATKRLGEALKADGLAPQDIRIALEEWRRSGASSPALLDLAGENTRALLRSAASKPGAARNAAVEYANQVTGDLQGNAIARTRALTPDRRPVSAVADEIAGQREVAAQRMYPAFASERVPVTDELFSAADGGSKWLKEAADLAGLERKGDVADEIAGLIRGDRPDTISAGALDYIRRAMRDAGGEAVRAGRGAMGRALGDRARDMEAALVDVPGFDPARSTYRGFSQQLDALDEGAKVLNQVPDDFAATFAKLPVEQGGIGARQAIEEAIGKPTEGATGTLNRLATSTNAGRNLETLYGADNAAHYRDAIGREIDRLSNARFVSPNTGSQTALREADDALVNLPPMTKAGVAKALFDKLRRGVSLTDAERKALMDLGTTILRSEGDIPAIPTTPQAMRLLSPVQRARLAQALASAEGARRAEPATAE